MTPDRNARAGGESQASGCDHVWFAVGRAGKPWERQCGGCGLWMTEEAERLALRCDALGIPDAAAALREVADGTRQ